MNIPTPPTPFLKDGKTPRCCRNIFEGYHFRQCQSRGKVERKGKPYCGTHDPVAIERKRAEKAAVRNKQWDERDAAYERKAAEEALAAAKLALWPELVEAGVEFFRAEAGLNRVGCEYPAGTCNAEDAHKEAGGRMRAAEKSLKQAIARAEKLK